MRRPVDEDDYRYLWNLLVLHVLRAGFSTAFSFLALFNRYLNEVDWISIQFLLKVDYKEKQKISTKKTFKF